MYDIIFEKYAKKNLIEILNFYALKGGINLAEKNKNRISKQINKLRNNPNMYPYSDIEPNLRQMLILKLPFKVYYLVDINSKKVHIIAILHTSRSHEELLGDINF